MEKESKIMICSDDGEWGREPTQKLSQRGVRALFLKRDSSLLLSKIREERPQLVIMDSSCLGWTPLALSTRWPRTPMWRTPFT